MWLLGDDSTVDDIEKVLLLLLLSFNRIDLSGHCMNLMINCFGSSYKMKLLTSTITLLPIGCSH